MKELYYSDWKENRVNKIKSIFGNNWFAGKSILELGSGDGNIGIDFLKLGADVTFSDIREEHLNNIKNKLTKTNFVEPKTILLNQEEEYNLNEKFDLILHLGVLYHIVNWKKDLESALNMTNTMILETVVLPEKVKEEEFQNANSTKNPYADNYSSVSKQNPHFTVKEIEEHLDSLGCKYLRIEDSKLNTDWCVIRSNPLEALRHIYDWNEDNYLLYDNKKYQNVHMHCRKIWLILK